MLTCVDGHVSVLRHVSDIASLISESLVGSFLAFGLSCDLGRSCLHVIPLHHSPPPETLTAKSSRDLHTLEHAQDVQQVPRKHHGQDNQPT